jgi:hypothetical protein
MRWIAGLLVIALGVGLAVWLARSDGPASPVVKPEPPSPPAAEAAPRPTRRAAVPPSVVAEATEEATAEDEAPPPLRTVRVAVHVVEQGTERPIDGAVVTFGPRRGADEEMRQARTDSAGVARSEFETRADNLQLLVRAPRFVVHGWLGESVEDDAVESTVELRPAETFEGVVLDALTGAPIAGATVSASEFKEEQGGWGRLPDEDLFDGLTAADGTFRVDAPTDADTNVSAVAPGYAREGTIRRAGDAARVELRLPPAGTVRGVVRDTEGKPVPSFGVVAVTADEGDGLVDRAETGADGRFELWGVALGRSYDVWAETYDYERGATNVVRGLRLTRDAPSAVVELTLQPAVRLELRVRLSDGAAAPGMVVVDARRRGPSGETDEDGRVAFANVQPGRVEIRVVPKNALPRDVVLDVRPGAPSAQEIVVEPGLAVAGVVVDDLGAPIENARVTVLQTSKDGAEVDHSFETDALGVFRLMGLERGPCWLAATSGDHEAVYRIESAAPASNVRIVLRRGGRVTLRLRPPGAVTQAHGHVRWRSHGGAAEHSVSFGNHDVPVVLRQQLPPGGWTASIRVTGFAEVERSFDVAIASDATLDVLLDEGATLSGRVQDVAGAPIMNAEVSWRSFGASTDGDGRFSFAHASREPAVLSVRAKGFLDGWMDTGAVEGVVVTLRRGGELLALVRDADGKPTQDFGVTIVDPEKPDAWKHDEPTVRANGRFESRLPEGRWRVRFWRGDKIVHEQDVELREGEKTPVEFEMPR